MNQLDLNKAFPKTPDCIHAAIEMGFKKGQKKMKMRNKIVAAVSAAAVLAVVTAASLGVSRDPKPDVLTQPPVTDMPKIQEEPIYVYSTDGADFYHLKPDCSGMENSVEMSEIEAVRMGKKACPTCIPIICNGHKGEEIEYIYYSQGAKYFHKQEECNGGRFDLKGEYFTVTRAFPGKEPCTICFPNGIEACVHEKAFVVKPEPTQMPDLIPAEETNAEPTAAKKKTSSSSSKSTTTVYYNEAGQYFHSDEHCLGMQNASAHSREDAQYSSKIGCPWCLNVYCTDSGSFYHLFPDCIGMQGATLRSVEEARSMVKTRCATCLDPSRVYATEKGRYCHVVQNCSGMKGAEPIPLDIAVVEKGKQLCPVCIVNSNNAAVTQ